MHELNRLGSLFERRFAENRGFLPRRSGKSGITLRSKAIPNRYPRAGRARHIETAGPGAPQRERARTGCENLPIVEQP